MNQLVLVINNYNPKVGTLHYIILYFITNGYF